MEIMPLTTLHIQSKDSGITPKCESSSTCGVSVMTEKNDFSEDQRAVLARRIAAGAYDKIMKDKYALTIEKAEHNFTRSCWEEECRSKNHRILTLQYQLQERSSTVAQLEHESEQKNSTIAKLEHQLRQYYQYIRQLKRNQEILINSYQDKIAFLTLMITVMIIIMTIHYYEFFKYCAFGLYSLCKLFLSVLFFLFKVIGKSIIEECPQFRVCQMIILIFEKYCSLMDVVLSYFGLHTRSTRQ